MPPSSQASVTNSQNKSGTILDTPSSLVAHARILFDRFLSDAEKLRRPEDRRLLYVSFGTQLARQGRCGEAEQLVAKLAPGTLSPYQHEEPGLADHYTSAQAIILGTIGAEYLSRNQIAAGKKYLTSANECAQTLPISEPMYGFALNYIAGFLKETKVRQGEPTEVRLHLQREALNFTQRAVRVSTLGSAGKRETQGVLYDAIRQLAKYDANDAWHEANHALEEEFSLDRGSASSLFGEISENAFLANHATLGQAAFEKCLDLLSNQSLQQQIEGITSLACHMVTCKQFELVERLKESLNQLNPEQEDQKNGFYIEYGRMLALTGRLRELAELEDTFSPEDRINLLTEIGLCLTENGQIREGQTFLTRALHMAAHPNQDSEQSDLLSNFVHTAIHSEALLKSNPEFLLYLVDTQVTEYSDRLNAFSELATYLLKNNQDDHGYQALGYFSLTAQGIMEDLATNPALRETSLRYASVLALLGDKDSVRNIIKICKDSISATEPAQALANFSLLPSLIEAAIVCGEHHMIEDFLDFSHHLIAIIPREDRWKITDTSVCELIQKACVMLFERAEKHKAIENSNSPAPIPE